jgi:hypothetical protein
MAAETEKVGPLRTEEGDRQDIAARTRSGSGFPQGDTRVEKP